MTGPAAWSALLFAAGPALCAGPREPPPAPFPIENHANSEDVVAIEVLGDSALIGTTGASYRIELPERLDRVEKVRIRGADAPLRKIPPTLEHAGCVYTPERRGVEKRCGRGSVVHPVHGFPATSVAVFRGRLLVGTFGGGLRELRAPGRRLPGFPDVVTALAATPRLLLVGTRQGLYVFDGLARRRIRREGPADNNITRVLKVEDTLWVATFDKGLSALRDGRWRHWTTEQGLPSDWVDDLHFDGGRLWGAGHKGLFWIEDGRVAIPEGTVFRNKTSALAGFGGKVYAAQKGAILVFEDGEVRTIPIPEEHPQDLHVDAKALWVAGLAGVYRHDGKRWSHFRSLEGSIPVDWVTALAPHPEGVIAGTYDGGVLLLDRGKGGVRPLLPRVWVNAGAIAVRGTTVAVGGMEEGLKLLWKGRWRSLGKKDGLAGDDVSAVAFDGDSLWVGTRSGLSRIALTGL
ncbi:MAG: hypothetical protein ABII00_06195 [Elusimicrobiota bacterium]